MRVQRTKCTRRSCWHCPPKLLTSLAKRTARSHIHIVLTCHERRSKYVTWQLARCVRSTNKSLMENLTARRSPKGTKSGTHLINSRVLVAQRCEFQGKHAAMGFDHFYFRNGRGPGLPPAAEGALFVSMRMRRAILFFAANAGDDQSCVSGGQKLTTITSEQPF